MLPSNGTPAQGATAEPERRAPGEAAATQPGRVRPGSAAVQTTPETARRPSMLSADQRAELQEAAAGGFAEDHAGMSARAARLSSMQEKKRQRLGGAFLISRRVGGPGLLSRQEGRRKQKQENRGGPGGPALRIRPRREKNPDLDHEIS